MFFDNFDISVINSLKDGCEKSGNGGLALGINFPNQSMTIFIEENSTTLSDLSQEISKAQNLQKAFRSLTGDDCELMMIHALRDKKLATAAKQLFDTAIGDDRPWL